MKKKVLKLLLVVFVAVILLILAIGLSLTTEYRQEQSRLEAVRSLPVPADWQLVQEKDTLVRGFCLGTGSKCGSLVREYKVRQDNRGAMYKAIASLEQEGWTFGEPYSFMSHGNVAYEVLQVSASHQQERLSISIAQDKATVYYTEQHNTE